MYSLSSHRLLLLLLSQSIQARTKALFSYDAVVNLIANLRACKDERQRHQELVTRLATMMTEFGKLLHTDRSRVEQKQERRLGDLTKELVDRKRGGGGKGGSE